VALIWNLNALRKKALAALLTTTLNDGATAFGGHTSTESVLTAASTLGGLIGAEAHDRVAGWRLKIIRTDSGAGTHSRNRRTLVNPSNVLIDEIFSAHGRKLHVPVRSDYASIFAWTLSC
jgi:hypothetical protein